jgi:hypothetical protein
MIGWRRGMQVAGGAASASRGLAGVPAGDQNMMTDLAISPFFIRA